MPDSATQDFSKVSSASSNLHPVPAPTSISAMPPCSDPNYRPTTLWMPTAPTFPVHPVMPGTPSTPGPPGLAKPVILPFNPAAPSTSTGFPSAAVPRQNMPTASDPNASHRGLPYPPIPSMVAPPQGYWLQHPQMSGVHRPPFHQYPAAFPGPFSFPARGGALPAVPVPDSQPPGVTPVGAASISAPAASSHLLRGTSGVQTEVISAHTGMPTGVQTCISSLLWFEK
jgi:transcription elongation regulator 1